MELSPHDYQGPFGTRWGDDPRIRSTVFSLFNPGFYKFSTPLPIIRGAIDMALAKVANLEDVSESDRALFRQFLTIANTAPQEIEEYVEFVLRRRTLPADEKRRVIAEHRGFWEKRKAERVSEQEGRSASVSL